MTNPNTQQEDNQSTSSASPNQGATSTFLTPRPNINAVETESIPILLSRDQPGPSGGGRMRGMTVSHFQNQGAAYVPHGRRKNLGEILCKVEKEKTGSCSKVECPYYHRDLNSIANQAKALFFIRHPLTVEVDEPPVQQFPHDSYRGSVPCCWEHIPGGCRREDCTFAHENGPFSSSTRRCLLLQIVPQNWRWPQPYNSTVQMWHNSPSHIYSVEQWVRNVSAGHDAGTMVRFLSFDATMTWMPCCLSLISEHPPPNWPLHYIGWDWVLGAAAAHWTPEFGQQVDPESGAVDEQRAPASEQQSPLRQIIPQWESLRWPPMEINPEWSTVIYSSWTTASVHQSSRWSLQQIYPQRPSHQIYPQGRPEQIYPQRPSQQIYPQRPSQQIYPQRPPQQMYPQRPPQQIYPQSPPQRIYPQRPPHQSHPQRPSQQMYRQRPPQQIYLQRPPQQSHPQRSSQQMYRQRPPRQIYLQRPPQQMIYPQRPPQQMIYPQRPPQQIYPQRPPQQIHPQWPPHQFIPQRPPQPINPQRPAGAGNARWLSAYSQQSSHWSPQLTYPQRPPRQVNAQGSWGWQHVAMAAGWQTTQYSYYIGPWSQNMLLRSLPAHHHLNVYFSLYETTSGYFVDSRGNYAGVPYAYPYQKDDRS